MRALAEEFAARKPAIGAVSEIAAGDALAIATRFDRNWAYRGALALFWTEAFKAHEVHDRYLPMPGLNPFERRGMLEVRGEHGGKPLTFIAAALSNDKSRIREIRFVRSALRAVEGDVVLFLTGYGADKERIGFADINQSVIVVLPSQ
jgi:hypothetical protein